MLIQMKNLSLHSKLSLSLAAVLCMVGCGKPAVDFVSLNEQAAREYLEPVRPGGDGAPFWNVFSPRFLYAPAFDFQDVAGAASYRFDMWLRSVDFSEGLLPVPEDRPAAADKFAEYSQAGAPVVSFTSGSPRAALSPVWNDVPVGNIGLVVTAVDASGNDIGFAGTREFVRDIPFQGPYGPAPRPYLKAAAMGLEFAEDYEPIVDGIRRMGDDLKLPQDVLQHYYGAYNTNYTPGGGSLFVSKFISAVIEVELELARMSEYGDEWYVDMARKAAAFLMANAEPEGSPLAHFTPTYYRDDRKVDLVMTMDPTMSLRAYLDLYDYTGDSLYYNEAVAVLKTFDRIIDADGYVPKKLVLSSGEPTVKAGALPAELMLLLLRMENDYSDMRFRNLRLRCEKYFNEVLLPEFDLSGQYEDVTVDLRQYQDLAMSWAVRFAEYLVRKNPVTEDDIRNARDLARFVEDQFVHWDMLTNGKHVQTYFTPGVYEQYYCALCIDASAAGTAQMYMSLYDATGDELYFQKAKALADAIVKAQNPHTGEIPTFWHRWYSGGGGFWINCTEHSAQALFRMDSYGK